MPDAEILSIKVKDETTGVVFNVYPGGQKPFITWTPDWSAKWKFQELTVRNNTSKSVVIYVHIERDGTTLRVLYSGFSPGETKDFAPSMAAVPAYAFPPTSYKVWTEIGGVKSHEVPFTLGEGCFIKTIPFHPNARIEYTTTGLLSDKIPGWLIYSHGATATLTVKLGWVKVGGVEYKGWGGAWLIDGAFNPNPVTLTVDHNITAQSLPGAFSPFLPLEDINLDGKVDMKDVLIVLGAYGSYPGHPKWNPLCDLIGDGNVDMKDLIRTIGAFGGANVPPPRTVSLYEARVAVSAMTSQAMAGAAATAAGIILAETAKRIMREVRK
jgi:hypothetical protein